ncbi:GDSL-type esterase/lipase family protein [Bhargavaea cecembensis]|uniref:GDSL-type esterase/lipase family protein n=1 Tax=Bhargavaea cecembensis TaxID=394098 RepID=UPI00058D285A|nr:GDSL-type esterase/lipase family protein [Bhargavaea cecembensis]
MKKLKSVLAVSLLANVVLLGFGGFYWSQSGSVKAEGEGSPNYKNPYYINKVSIFKALPDKPVDRAFIGDSLTDHGEFAEYFPGETVINRGIRDDTSAGLLKRIGEVADRAPKKAYIMIGTNDILQGADRKEYEENLRKIVDAFDPAGTQVTLQSILPVNTEISHRKIDNKEVVKYNRIVKKIAKESGAEYLNLDLLITHGEGRMDPKYTVDGIHLKGNGYDEWVEKVKEKD